MPSDTGRKIPFPFTAFPNSLLDTVMPLLRDTEWRVLCAVVRRTVNFRQDAQAGRPTWITRSQLLAATGRDSEAVSRAVDALVQRRLVSVCDEAGLPLDSPTSRRAARGKQLFALHPLLLRSINLAKQEEITASLRKFEHSSREEDTAKSNSLKEKAVKNAVDPKSKSALWIEAKQIFSTDSSAPAITEARTEQLSFTDWKEDAFLRDFFALFQARYVLRFQRPVPASGLSTAQAAQLRQRWGEEGADRIQELLDYFFTLDWLWVVNQHHSPGAFASSFNLLRLTYGKKGFRSPQLRSTPPATGPSPEP